MKTNQLNSGVILSYIAIGIQSLVSIIYTPVMLRFLGQSSYGLLQLAISSVSVLGILSFGFDGSYLRFYTKYKSAGDERAIAELNGMFALIFIFAALAAAAAGSAVTLNAEIIFSRSMAPEELSRLKTLLGIMTLNLALSFPCSIFDSYIVSQERFAFQKTLLIITSLMNPMLTFPLILLGKGPASVAVCITFITFTRLAASMIFCIKRLKMRFGFKADSALLKHLCSFSFFVFLNIVSDQVNWNVDKTLLGILKSPASVAAYSIGSQFNSYFLTFSYALMSVFSPKAYLITENDKSGTLLSKFFAQFGRMQLIVMAYIYMMFIAVGRQFISVWSGIDSSVPYYTALLLISPLLITSAQSIGIEIQRAKDMHKFRSVLYFLIALGNILISVPLCIRFGEIGCAAGTCICLVIGNIVIMNIYYQKRVGLDIIYFLKQLARLLPSFIPPAAAAVLLNIFIKETVPSIIIGSVTLTAVYWVCAVLFGLSKEEKQYAAGILKKGRFYGHLP